MGHLSLAARAVTVSYGGRTVLCAASLDVRPGSRLALLGANGSGKTTLLRVLSGALRPDAGQVRVGPDALRHSRAGLTAHRQQVQLVLQDPDDQLFAADVARDVSFGPLNLRLAEDEVRSRVDEALEVLGLRELAERPTHQLSFGQRKRVAIAGAVAMRPCLLLLDEPTAGLDATGVDEMLTALHRLEEWGTTVLLSTHDVDFALAWATEVAVVEAGRVLQGDPGALLGDTGLLARARLRRPWVLELADRLDVSRGGAPSPRDLESLVAALTDFRV
ncbi:energy-coupling factor ABC transporter ATP-binding protein [Intrasporangium calvum]|uniref:energy-coupling factor ABC transporter ATP-binding protein n=1 Tax=Intrasporangium calvum TaxID=53358 RepID=UPI000DF618F9|nr:ATP-binding cassette domain-containing protein [Intrasporangium calvum]AXG12570.1 ATP-binding cassette domain-containing protein [Intrasporangium calvum]